MANEIMVLKQNTDGLAGDSGASFNFLFFAVLDPVIEVNGVRVIPTPSSGIPQEVMDYGLLSVGELQALDSGEAIFSTSAELFRSPGMSQNDYLQFVRDAYNNQIDQAVQILRDQYQFYGLQINA